MNSLRQSINSLRQSINSLRQLKLQRGLLIMLIMFLAMTRPAIARPLAAGSGSNDGITLSAEAGFDGYYKPYTWIPVTVEIENTAASPSQGSLRARFTDASPADISSLALDLPAGTRKSVSLLLYAPGYGYTVEISYEGRTAAGQTQKVSQTVGVTSLNTNDTLIGVIASAPSEFNLLKLVFNGTGSAITTALQPAWLPDQSLALASLNVLVIANIDTSGLSAAQTASLAAWVRGGGRLIVCGGAGWQKTTAGLAGRLSGQSPGLLPIEPAGTRQNADWQPLYAQAQTQEAAFGGSQQDLTPLTDSALVTTGNLIEPLSGPPLEVLASAGGLPLAVRQPSGSGEVVFLAFDPQQPPFRAWNGMESLYTAWFGGRYTLPLWGSGFSDWYNAANAVQTLPNLNIPPIWLVCGFLVLYMLALGPVNFIVLRRLKRPELAWVTIPVMVIGFSLVILVSGGLTRGQRPILNRLAVLQTWPDSPAGLTGSARLDALVGVYSPGRSTYTLDFGSLLPHSLPNQSGFPQNGLEIIHTGSGFQAAGLQVDVSGIRSLVVEGSLPAPDIRADLQIEFDANGPRLVGNIYNNSSFDLQKVALLSPGGAVTLGDLKAGEILMVDQAVAGLAAGSPGTVMASPLGPAAGSPLNIMPVFFAQPNQVEAIMGTSDFYSDRPTYRRYSLLMGLLQNTQAAFSGTGYYLTAWSSQAVLPVELNSILSDTQDTTLLIIQVNPHTPANTSTAAEINIPAAMFTVRPLNAGAMNANNYGMYLYGGDYLELEFSLNPKIALKKVTGLNLLLDNPNYPSGGILIQPVTVRLWDFSEQDWVVLDDMSWGDNAVPDPGRFVGPQQEVRFSLNNPPQNNINLNAISISLTAVP